MWRRVSWHSSPTYVPLFGGTLLQSSVATLTKPSEGTSSRWYTFTRLHGVRKTAILLLGGWEKALHLSSSRASGIWRAVPEVSKDCVVFIRTVKPSRPMLPLVKKKTWSFEASWSQRHSYLPEGLNPQQLRCGQHCVLYNCWSPVFLLGSKLRKIKHIKQEGCHKVGSRFFQNAGSHLLNNTTSYGETPYHYNLSN
jgi:hypothetical protein